ncbi:hypothetical protein R5W24_002502 [Gemmata sp. JC717]|uniref:hypothetical protein n=1 Tax=Gemmata algarum TaxID=2975278 RepID=UPI0021BBA515|nr:hypothetical protein [Gemmata algarum]MDY3553401.1 hypothetical protein [Gemmata algarum]
MTPLPLAEWTVALDRMDAALAAATQAIERRDERLERAVAPSAGEGELPALDRIDARLADWEPRLRAAEELVASVERELADRATAAGAWRALFADWEQLLKRGNVAP